MAQHDPLKSHLLEQAQANRWINQEWWQALKDVSLGAMEQPQGAFFGSLFATWDHLLLTDRSWLSRVTGKPFAFKTLADRLSHTKEDFARERAITDAEWVSVIQGESDVRRTVAYRNSRGEPFSNPLYQVFQHNFIHQAHHRGQIHQMCDERQIKLPDGGLIGFYRTQAALPMGGNGGAAGLREVLLEQANANRWINREWWKVLRPLSLEELDRPQGAFFGSIFATWNHILLADRVWLGRITERPFAITTLADRLCQTVDQFLAEREKTDLALIDQVAAEPDFARVLRYRGNQSQPYETPLHQVFQHVFAHQAHHRGQIHQMCDERKIKLPDGGLIGFYRR